MLWKSVMQALMGAQSGDQEGCVGNEALKVSSPPELRGSRGNSHKLLRTCTHRRR